MTNSNEISVATLDNVSRDRIKNHVIIVAILNLVAAVFYLLVSAMILYNVYFTDFNSQNEGFATAIAIAAALIALPYLCIGVGILLRIRLARFAAILCGFMHLFEIPYGTPLGIYTLWVFFTQDTDSYFGKDPVPNLKIYSEED